MKPAVHAWLAIALGAGALYGGLAAAQTAAGADAKAAAAQVMTDGEVRKVDKAAKKITLKHGDIKNLDMPGMTMAFPVKDPALLENVQVGDKVKFHAEMTGGNIVVTDLKTVK
jgi:Cu/Ag efflux protein CusF